MNYVLDERGTPVLEPDLMTWARWMEDFYFDQRRVARTEVGDVHVSTVFLGADYNWSGGPPILYETMIFGGEYDQYQRRHHTRAEAVASHDQIVAALREGNEPT